MTIANKLVGKGYNRRTAMLKAWVIAKAERLSVRIAGTSFNRRQSVLKAMESKPAVLKLKHESTNAADRNAVSLWAFPEGAKGFAVACIKGFIKACAVVKRLVILSVSVTYAQHLRTCIAYVIFKIACESIALFGAVRFNSLYKSRIAFLPKVCKFSPTRRETLLIAAVILPCKLEHQVLYPIPQSRL